MDEKKSAEVVLTSSVASSVPSGILQGRRSILSQRSTDSKKHGNESDEAVKFPSFPDLHDMEPSTTAVSESNRASASMIQQDETLVLFDCMPKGLESFMEFGPSRRVVDYMDYEKLCNIQKKKIQYLKEQQVPQANRAKDIHEKSLELQEHFKLFDVFVSDAQKKKARAQAIFSSCHHLNKELDLEIPKAVKRLIYHREIRDKIMMKVLKYQPVEEFIESIIRGQDTQFHNFNALKDRNSTLRLTNKYLTKRFTERHLVEKELIEELQAVTEKAKTHGIVGRKEVDGLKKIVNTLTRENIDLEQKCNLWTETANEKLKESYQMVTSIRNISRLIMNIRPYTARSMADLTDPIDLIEKIGMFITDYSEIINNHMESTKGKSKKITEKRDDLSDM